MNTNEKLTYVNERGQRVEFSIHSPFFCTGLTGQDGLKNNIYTSKGTGQDGVTLTGDNLESRDIAVQGVLRGDKERNRSLLLSMCNPKLKAKLIYDNAGVEKYIDCIIEKAPVITKESLPKFIINFFCPNPYWQDANETKIEVALWTGDFHFPLEILAAGIMMGHRSTSLIVNVLNPSDAQTGMTIEFKAKASVVNPALINVNDPTEFIKINKTMVSGEVLTVTTGYGNKKVTSIISGITTNAFNSIDIDSTFSLLDPGDNLFGYDATSGIDNLEVTIRFTPIYLGV